MSKLFLIIGHSGSGKTTIMRSIMSNEIVSFTTRPKRPNEIDGIDYNFITLDQYNYLKSNNLLIESAEYAGNYYGISKDELEIKLSKGHAFCIVNLHGLEQLKSYYSNCVSILLYTDIDSAIKHMVHRGENKEFITKRLSTYQQEVENKKYCDYVIKNKHGYLDKTIEIVKKIIEIETL
jgi:guanylate kinase